MPSASHILSLALILAATTEHCSCFSIAAPILVKNAAAPTTRLFAAGGDTDVLTKGRLVEFSTGTGASKTTNLGAIVGLDGKKNLKILTSSGRTSSVPPRAIRHIVPNGWSISEQAQIEQHERAAAKGLESDIAVGGQNVLEVWEMLLEDDAETVELTTLADLIVGDDSSFSCYATRAILADGVESFCFKEISTKGKLSEENACPIYEPRPPDVVETMKSRARVEAEEQAKWVELKQRIDEACGSSVDAIFDIERETEEIQAAFHSLVRLGCLASLSPEDAEREETAAIGDDSVSLASAKAFLKQIGHRSTPESARAILVGIGEWNLHTNLDMIRLRIPTAFGPGLEDLATEIATSPPADVDEASRLDLTHLSAFAIDEASTREIDDALSVETLQTDGPIHSRQRLWVHIADPSRYIELGSPLEKEARRRASSLYLPTGTVPMFPMSLASGPLSLNPGEVSCALSVGLMLDADGGIDASTPPIITPSLVRTTRLTYVQVDKLLDPFAIIAMIDGSSRGSDSEDDAIEDIEATVESLRQLDRASEQRLQWRKDGGSLESIGPYELPDMFVKAQPSPDEPDGWGVEIFARERFAASRIVTELMLAANEAIATYGEVNGVPMPFRCQEMDEVSDLEIDATPEGPCRSWLAIRSTFRSQITSTPRPHAGLGLDLYVQATSPVRRYADLALHHQIKAHLRGDTLPFPANDNNGGAEDSSDTANDMVRLAQNGGTKSRELERPANDYWLREFLRRRGAKPTEVLVLSGDRRKEDVYKLLLPELGAIITYKSARSLAIGGQMDVSSLALAEFV